LSISPNLGSLHSESESLQQRSSTPTASSRRHRPKCRRRRGMPTVTVGVTPSNRSRRLLPDGRRLSHGRRHRTVRRRLHVAVGTPRPSAQWVSRHPRKRPSRLCRRQCRRLTLHVAVAGSSPGEDMPTALPSAHLQSYAEGLTIGIECPRVLG
jgi:hypothetical protein